MALNSTPETAPSASDAVAEFVGAKVPPSSFDAEEGEEEGQEVRINDASGANSLKTHFELPFQV